MSQYTRGTSSPPQSSDSDLDLRPRQGGNEQCTPNGRQVSTETLLSQFLHGSSYEIGRTSLANGST